MSHKSLLSVWIWTPKPCSEALSVVNNVRGNYS